MANLIVAQMLFLEAESPERHFPLHQLAGRGDHRGHVDLRHHEVHQAGRQHHLYGPGVLDGLFLLTAGAKGKRFCLPNSRVMIHQPLGGYQARRRTSKSTRVKSLR